MTYVYWMPAHAGMTMSGGINRVIPAQAGIQTALNLCPSWPGLAPAIHDSACGHAELPGTRPSMTMSG